jgi:hypothetical protein
MTWDPNVTVTVVSGAQPVDRAVLNIPLHLVATPTFPERVRTYGSPAEAAADTLLGADGLAAVNAHFAQDLYAPTIKIGRSADTPAAQVVTITVGGTPLENEVYEITINGIKTEYVAGAAPTVTTVHVGLKAAHITAIAAEEITVAGVDPDITDTADNAGEQFSYSVSVTAAPGQSAATGTLVAVLTTPNAGIGSDLDACLVADNAWYGLTTGIHPTPATNLVLMKSASSWAEINDKLYVAQSDEATVLTGTAGNDLLELSAKNNGNTAYVWHHDDTELVAVAVMSYVFWADPDVRTTNWAYKPLSGISLKPTRLTTTEQGYITSQNGNCVVAFGGNANFGMGVTTTGGKIDVVTTKAWLKARLQEAYIQLLSDFGAADDKIGINDKELTVIPNTGQKILDQGVRAKHLNAGSTSISIPLRADMPDADVTARLIRVTASGVVTGAAELITVTMTLSLV